MRGARGLLRRAVIVATLIGISASASTALSGPTLRFAAPRVVLRVSANAPVTDIASADFNGDGLVDAIVTRLKQESDESFPVTILLNRGGGRFIDASRSMFDGSPPLVENPRQIVIADFNGDRKPDVFLADTGMDALPFPGHRSTLLLSQPDRRLVDATANLPPEAAYTHSAAAGDVDGNGTIDLYMGNLSSGCEGCARLPPEILLNDGTGHFRVSVDALPASVGAPLMPHYTGSALADVNGDRSPDLILAADHQADSNLVLLNDGAGRFRVLPNALPAKAFGANTEGLGIATADVNGDGHLDLFIAATKWDPFYRGVWLQLLVGNGDGTFRDETSTRLPQSNNDAPWVAFPNPIDLNGDGKPDLTTRAVTLAVLGRTASPTMTYLNDGHGTFKPIHVVPTGLGIYAFVNDRPAQPNQDVLAVAPLASSESYIFYKRLRANEKR